MKIIQLCLLIFWVQVHAKAIFANPWIKEFEILQTTPRKPAKTAILIILMLKDQVPLEVLVLALWHF